MHGTRSPPVLVAAPLARPTTADRPLLQHEKRRRRRRRRPAAHGREQARARALLARARAAARAAARTRPRRAEAGEGGARARSRCVYAVWPAHTLRFLCASFLKALLKRMRFDVHQVTFNGFARLGAQCHTTHTHTEASTWARHARGRPCEGNLSGAAAALADARSPGRRGAGGARGRGRGRVRAIR